MLKLNNCSNCNRERYSQECVGCIVVYNKTTKNYDTPSKWQPKDPEKVIEEQVQQIAEENEQNCDTCKHYSDMFDCLGCDETNGWETKDKNCDTCKHDNTYFDCSQCSDFDEWEEQKDDLIHNPSHYTYSEFEPIDVIKAWNLDFDLGNVVKYIARCEHKGNKIQDLNKALEYLQHEIKSLEVDK